MRCSFSLLDKRQREALSPLKRAGGVSGDNGFEPVGQVHQFELARVVRAIERVAHHDLLHAFHHTPRHLLPLACRTRVARRHLCIGMIPLICIPLCKSTRRVYSLQVDCSCFPCSAGRWIASCSQGYGRTWNKYTTECCQISHMCDRIVRSH